MLSYRTVEGEAEACSFDRVHVCPDLIYAIVIEQQHGQFILKIVIIILYLKLFHLSDRLGGDKMF